MSFLLRRVRLGDYWSGLAESEAGLAEQSLTLAYAKLDVIFLRDPGGQRLAIPQVNRHARICRPTAQNAIHFPQLGRAQPRRTPRTLAFGQSRQAPVLKPTYPIFNRPRCVPKEMPYLRTCQSLCYQQHAMQPVVISRFLRTLNLLL